jgi:hypothetical protein
MDTQLSPFLTPGNPGVSPVAPGAVQANADAGRSIQQGAENAGNELVEAIKQHKQNVQDQADANTTFKMIVPMMAQAGAKVDPDILSKFAGASLAAKKGMIGALTTTFATQQKAKMDAAQQQELQARAGYYGDVGAARQQATSDSQAQAGALARWAQSMDQNSDFTSTLKPVEKAQFHALATMGASNPRVAGPLLKNLFDQYGPGSQLQTDKGPQPFNQNGVSGVFDPKTGKYTITGQPAKAPTLKSGKYPKGTAFPKGVLTATYPDGTQDVVGHENGQVALIDTLNGQGAPAAGAPAPGAAAAMAAPAIPQEYIDYLTQHPEQAASFDLKYGEGAAEKILGEK